jgi:hypothetical protein
MGSEPKPGRFILSYGPAGYSTACDCCVTLEYVESRESVTMVVLAARFLENGRSIDYAVTTHRRPVWR